MLKVKFFINFNLGSFLFRASTLASTHKKRRTLWKSQTELKRYRCLIVSEKLAC